MKPESSNRTGGGPGGGASTILNASTDKALSMVPSSSNYRYLDKNITE